jgi:hypothetical protein
MLGMVLTHYRASLHAGGMSSRLLYGSTIGHWRDFRCPSAAPTRTWHSLRPSAIIINMSRSVNTPVLERMLGPVTRSLNVDAAKKLVRLKADAKVQARVAKLARKCNEGQLTAEELAEYDRYIAVADVVAILQAHARLLLAKQPR